MKHFNIAGANAPILRTTCKEVPNDLKLRESLKDFLEVVLMHTKKAVGLAAPQVYNDYRAFVYKYQGKFTVVFNPIVKATSLISRKAVETCLSFKDKYKVRRPLWCIVTYQDEHCKKHTKVLLYKEACVVMHEIDHLNGICIDKGKKVEQ